MSNTFVMNVFVQFSSVPWPVTCDVCICEPSVDNCPLPVVFNPGFTVAGEFSLFGWLKGGVYIKVEFEPVTLDFSFYLKGWLDEFSFDLKFMKIVISGYVEPNFVQAPRPRRHCGTLTTISLSLPYPNPNPEFVKIDDNDHREWLQRTEVTHRDSSLAASAALTLSTRAR